MNGTAAPADWTVYDRPDLRDTIGLPGAAGACETLIGLDGMHCASCSARVERLLAPVASNLRINLPARVVEFAWEPRRVRLSEILRRLDQAGFAPRVLAQDRDLRGETRERRGALLRIGVSAIASMQVMMLASASYFGDGPTEPAMLGLFRWSQWLLATPVVLYGGWPFFANAARALRERMLNMDVPVALALAIAYLASAWRTWTGAGEIYFDTATMFVLLLSAGRYLEGRTRAKATERLRLLAGRRALTARRRTAGGVAEVPLALLAAGDLVEVMPGEAAPADGDLCDGPAELDESLLTGESRPVRREAGERVLAGSINAGVQALLVRATRVGADTTLSQITRLLNRAQTERPRVQVLADRLAGHFIFAVLALAGVGAWLGGEQGLSIALAVLVASCPCALSLAVPAALAAASSRLAAGGALLARPEALARLPQVDTVIFDKTGTLTEAAFRIALVRPLADAGPGDCLAIAAALERGSTHPIARAFAEVPPRAAAQDVRHEPACGVAGLVDGRRYWLGAPDRAPVPLGEHAALLRTKDHAHCTWLALSDDRRLLALFALAAPERAEARAVVRALRGRGLDLELLTGDAAEAAATVAARLGIARFDARRRPQDKLERLRRLRAQGHRVLAVGDGINDAPFLAAADVAVAMPDGAALAQSRADVILVGGSLQPLPELFALAGRTARVVRQNVAWALAYNLAVLPLAMLGWLAPWVAALGMSASSLLVVTNALRLAAGPRVAGRP